MKITALAFLALTATTLLSCASIQQRPMDVERFVERRDVCDHLRGEIPDQPSPERTKEIVDGISKYCTGTDMQLETLKNRYANNQSIMSILNSYEADIEARSGP